METEIIHTYFPDLSALQSAQLMQLGGLYAEWNKKINVISRQDIGNLYERHILHSLGIAKVIQFERGTKVLDAGTGGGFPGIPLAILFPEAQFHLVDSTAKKLVVVNAVAAATGLKNITTEHCRFEDHYKKYDFIVSRAVASLDVMVSRLRKNISLMAFNDIPNGMLYLKGGDFAEELRGMEAGKHGGMGAGRHGGMEAGRQGSGEAGKKYIIYPLSDYFQEDFFETKSVVHLF